MSDRLAVVLNPASQSGGSADVKQTVRQLAVESGVATVFDTVRAGHGTELAREAVDKGFERVVAVGGDGTVNEVMNALVRTPAALAVVPLGTGNDWVRTVGIPNDPVEAWKVAVGGRVVESDVGEAVGHRYFLNVAGVGFDAEVARTIGEASGLLAKLGPKQRYEYSVLRTFFGYRGADTVLTIDGEERKLDKLFLLAVAVAKYYGSGMMIAPEAEIDDGLFDLVWGRDVRMHELPGLLSQIYKGTHISHPKVGSCQCKEVSLSSVVPLPFHLDGDVVGTLPVTFRIHEKALRIVVPEPMERRL